jgi:hypothetical protein
MHVMHMYKFINLTNLRPLLLKMKDGIPAERSGMTTGKRHKQEEESRHCIVHHFWMIILYEITHSRWLPSLLHLIYWEETTKIRVNYSNFDEKHGFFWAYILYIFRIYLLGLAPIFEFFILLNDDLIGRFPVYVKIKTNFSSVQEIP